MNLMLKVSETFSQGAVGLSLRGTDFFLPILYDLNNNKYLGRKGRVIIKEREREREICTS